MEIRVLRRSSKHLIAMGACATAGGIRALRSFADVKALAALVYPHPDWIAEWDRSTPISSHVKVDFELRGCPVRKEQLLEVIGALLGASRPDFPTENGVVRMARINCFEPPRVFEAFLRGRSFSEVPDFMARICGICPSAHQITVVKAIEHSFGVEGAGWGLVTVINRESLKA